MTNRDTAIPPLLLDIATANEKHDDAAIEDANDAFLLHISTHPVTDLDDLKIVLQMARYYPTFHHALRLFADAPEG